MPRKRDAVASCAICYDPLFGQLDDLDEDIPQVMPSCGHVFHEPCIKRWFQSQEERYVAEMQPRRMAWEPPVTAADAPVECPTCRKECLADEETGETLLHRLYLAFDERHGGSSQIGSSPARSLPVQRTAADEEMMRLARRAKRLGDEVSNMSADVTEGVLDSALDKAEALRQDAVSAKASAAVKKYIGGLTSSINTLRSHIKESPLAATLRDEITRAQERVRKAEAEVKRIRSVEIAQIVANTKQDVMQTSQKEAKTLKAKLRQVEDALAEERAGNRATIREAEARLAHEKAETASANARATRLEEEKTQLVRDLRERTTQLRKHQQKSESRKVLQDTIKKLEDDRAALQTALANSMSENKGFDDNMAAPDSPHDASQASGSVSRPKNRLPMKRHSDVDITDESLVVEMPSFHSRRLESSSPTKSLGPSSPVVSRTSKAHPTARTFTFNSHDMGGKPGQPSKKQSKYFLDNQASDVEIESDIDERAEGRQVIVPPSSDAPEPSNTRSRTNPFLTGRQGGHMKSKAKIDALPREVEVIEIVDTSYEADSPLRTANTNVAVPGSSRIPARQKSVTEMFGWADRNGRPTKGLVSGAKARRKV